MSVALKIENVSKMYRLGTVGTGTLSHDLNRWWAMIRGKEDPTLKIGQVNDRTKSRESSDENPAEGKSRTSDSDYVWALKNINLEVKEGEILGIIGRNGAGKSTLLKLLSRVTAPTTGSIRAKGRIASLLEVGTGFHPELTGRENVYLNGAIMGMTRPEIKKRLDEIVEFSGCAKYIDTPVKRYSSGMTVRLGFAVAAHLDCEILIVDEVLAVGDAAFQQKCLAKMTEIGREGRTILFVSHNMQSVSTLTTQVALIENGEVGFTGMTDVGIKRYLVANSNPELTYSSERAANTARVTSVEVCTSEPSNVHRWGQPLTVNITIDSAISICDTSLSFQVIDGYGNPITHLWIFDTDTQFCRTPGEYDFECKIDQPLLYMGNYSLRIYLNGGESGSRLDYLESVCPFEIVMHGIDRKHKWNRNAAKYLERGIWKISKY